MNNFLDLLENILIESDVASTYLTVRFRLSLINLFIILDIILYVKTRVAVSIYFVEVYLQIVDIVSNT